MEAVILNQEQIRTLLDEGKIDYSTCSELSINDFLFNDSAKYYEQSLNLLFMEYFKHVDYYDKNNEAILQTFKFFSFLCRNRELLVQIATDKGILYNPKNQ